jgi:hypothetical protein
MKSYEEQKRDLDRKLRQAFIGFVVYATVVLGILITLGYAAYHFLAKVW